MQGNAVQHYTLRCDSYSQMPVMSFILIWWTLLSAASYIIGYKKSCHSSSLHEIRRV
uniref:Uncharacterized protein n=1 Tax=Anguilla anguilla TaxID=7936 RepID=A0A0E9WJ41_ANGAN